MWKGVWRDLPDCPVWDELEWNKGVMESWYDGMMKSRNQKKKSVGNCETTFFLGGRCAESTNQRWARSRYLSLAAVHKTPEYGA